MSDNASATPWHGPYLVRSSIGMAYLRALDAALSVIVGDQTAPRDGPIGKLLIGIGGSLGDAVIASSILPAVHEALPDTEIGIVLPSLGHSALTGHPFVRWTHVVDHWRSNRSAISWLAKRRISSSTHARA